MKPEQLAARLEGGAFAEAKERAMHKIVLIGLRKSQPRTPVRSGTLRRSETTRVEKAGEAGFLGTNIEYAPFIHERVPFFAEGIEEGRSEMIDALQQEVERFLGEVSG